MSNAERPQDFAGRTALVTGATRGIGLGIARELVERGANVVVTARKPEELEATVRELDPQGTGRAVSSRGSADDEAHRDPEEHDPERVRREHLQQRRDEDVH